MAALQRIPHVYFKKIGPTQEDVPVEDLEIILRAYKHNEDVVKRIRDFSKDPHLICQIIFSDRLARTFLAFANAPTDDMHERGLEQSLKLVSIFWIDPIFVSKDVIGRFILSTINCAARVAGALSLYYVESSAEPWLNNFAARYLQRLEPDRVPRIFFKNI
jgi:hypothetical protein